MSKIKLTPEQTRVDLDALLMGISDTKVSATKDKKFSDTKISSTKYMNQYKKEHYDTIRFDVPKGMKSQLQAEATKRGMSLTKLIMASLEMYITNN